MAAALVISSGVTSGAAHAAGKTLVYCSEGSPDSFNPQTSTSGTTFDAFGITIYNRLVDTEPGGTRFVPALAESWQVSADGLHYTFKLRRGVKFHSHAKFSPSRTFNADDVLFSFNRMADKKHPFHASTPGKSYLYYEDKGLDKLIVRLEKLDEATVRFVLRQPDAAFLVNLAHPSLSIFSGEYGAKLAAANTLTQLDSEPIGTGPFQLTSYQKDATIRYKAFDGYFRGRPKLDNLIFAITPDASVRYAKLKTNECQVMAFPKAADLVQMKNDPNLKLITQDGLNIGYLAFHTGKKPFDNKLVRQAMVLAVDRAAILKNVYQGNAKQAKNPYPPALWSYNDKINDYPHDPAKAKALLQQAGLPNGFSFDLWYLPVQRPYNPDGKRIAEQMQADLAKIGVKANLLTFEWTEYLKRSKNGEHQAVMFGWSAAPDPDEYLGPLLSCEAAESGGNRARWCHAGFDELYRKAKITSLQAERSKLYEKAQQIFHEEVPWLTLAHAILVTPVRKQVLGYLSDPLSFHHFETVDLVK